MTRRPPHTDVTLSTEITSMVQKLRGRVVYTIPMFRWKPYSLTYSSLTRSAHRLDWTLSPSTPTHLRRGMRALVVTSWAPLRSRSQSWGDSLLTGIRSWYLQHLSRPEDSRHLRSPTFRSTFPAHRDICIIWCYYESLFQLLNNQGHQSSPSPSQDPSII